MIKKTLLIHTKNLDSNTNKIKESYLMYDNDTISSSKNVTTVDIDNFIIKLTNQMKKNFVTAKADLTNMSSKI